MACGTARDTYGDFCLFIIEDALLSGCKESFNRYKKKMFLKKKNVIYFHFVSIFLKASEMFYIFAMQQTLLKLIRFASKGCYLRG